jgi:hypothetical protein
MPCVGLAKYRGHSCPASPKGGGLTESEVGVEERDPQPGREMLRRVLRRVQRGRARVDLHPCLASLRERELRSGESQRARQAVISRRVARVSAYTQNKSLSSLAS